MGGSLQPAGACETIKERVPEYALLPPGTKGYLQEKVEKALKTAKYVPVRLRDGSIVHRLLMQSAMSVPMMIEEEFEWKWLFKYKAEVSFDMMPFFATGGVAAPIPFLSSEKPHGTERRRSRNPIPPGAKLGALRRPDVIIVEKEAILWPGRGTVDREGGHHVNNMLRLVEVKFPGDNWGLGQEEAYRAISGDFKNRMTVIDVTDCNGDLQKIPKPAPIPAPKTEDEKNVSVFPFVAFLPSLITSGTRTGGKRHMSMAMKLRRLSPRFGMRSTVDILICPLRQVRSCISMRHGCLRPVSGSPTRRIARGYGLTRKGTRSFATRLRSLRPDGKQSCA
ncbi:bacteriophage gp30 protein [Burkholderia lata]|uniref:VRR-NUC domain-containing protein n=1 Tax=Burkholderia lata (strain ATCC 17760 / DSM 23089 / LMG 22485 / NCIMB 9086 / R18194 / 383) TaxID=482957 RepID=UPI0014543E4A|nr:VRR-NUC domain-containing protein [Burkholderia lata]VWC75298.1 bacteriophage gp30 protein [Burkholderia lata]